MHTAVQAFIARILEKQLRYQVVAQMISYTRLLRKMVCKRVTSVEPHWYGKFGTAFGPYIHMCMCHNNRTEATTARAITITEQYIHIY